MLGIPTPPPLELTSNVLCVPPLASKELLKTKCVFPCVATSSPLQGFVSTTAQGTSSAVVVFAASSTTLTRSNAGLGYAPSGPVMLDALSQAAAISATAAPAIKKLSCLIGVLCACGEVAESKPRATKRGRCEVPIRLPNYAVSSVFINVSIRETDVLPNYTTSLFFINV